MLIFELNLINRSASHAYCSLAMIAWKFCDQKNSITIHSPDFSLVFFFRWLKVNFGKSEPVSWNRRTRNTFLIIPRVVLYVIITWAETKILKEETKWTVRVSRVFMLSYIASLRKVTKITANTRMVYKQNRKKQEWWKTQPKWNNC